MSNEDRSEAPVTTVLVHLEDAATKLEPVIQQFVDGEIDKEVLAEKANEAAPRLNNVGCEYNTDSDVAYVNTQPVPKNAESAVYFWRDENDTLKMTVRLFRYGDNETLDSSSDDYATLCEAAAFDILRLINMEHQSVLEKVMVAQMMEGMEHLFNGGEESEADDDPLNTIEDEEVKDQIRKMSKH